MNYENDAALGISATETTRNAKANELYGKSFNDLSEAQKQLTLLSMVEEGNELSGALGQAARESDGLENVLGNLRQAWEDIKVKFGEPILAPAVAGIQKLTEWLMKVDTSKITGFAEWVISYFNANVLPIFTQFYTDIQTYFPVVQSVFSNVFSTIWEVANEVYLFFKDNILPIFLSVFTWVQGHMPTIQATFQTVFSKVVAVAKTVWAFFKDNILPILQRFLGFIQKNMPTIQRIVENVFKIIGNVVKVVWDIFENLLLPALKALWDYIVAPAFSKIQTIIEKVFGGIFNAVDAVVGAFEAVTNAVKKAIDWLTSWNNKKVSKKTVQVEEKRSGGASAAFATGTNYAPGGVALVGERGPELVELPRGSKVKTANETKQLLNNGGVKELRVEAPIYLDGYQIAKAVFPTIDLMQGNKLSSNMRLSGVKG